MTLTSGNPKGAVKLEIERPVLFEVSADRIQRVIRIIELVNNDRYHTIKTEHSTRLHSTIITKDVKKLSITTVNI